MAVGGVWLGATDATQEGGWYWTDDVPFAYVNWDSGEVRVVSSCLFVNMSLSTLLCPHHTS